MHLDSPTPRQELMLRAERAANLYYAAGALVALLALANLLVWALGAPPVVTYVLAVLLTAAYVTNRIAWHRCENARAHVLDLPADPGQPTQ